MAEIIEENLRVVSRIRPKISKVEVRKKIGIHQLDEKTIQVESSEKQGQTFQTHIACDGKFDNESFFETSGLTNLLDSALAGYSSTVFAYGQTGSGKSHTLLGKSNLNHNLAEDDPGMIPRSIDYIYEEINSMAATHSFTIRVTCMEIYNDQVFDLLEASNEDVSISTYSSSAASRKRFQHKKNKSLTVRWSSGIGFFVQNLKLFRCDNKKEMHKVISDATRSRKIGSHNLNATSSRSHVLVTLYIDSIPLDKTSGNVETYGKICFADLAGSEKAKDSGSSGIGLKEAGQINKSLYVLSKVIAKISKAYQPGENMSTVGVIPFRESTITKLLIDSLGGNSKTLMIACLSPIAKHVGESLRTLQFAMSAKMIKNKPVVLLNPHEKLVQDLKSEIHRLRQENLALKVHATTNSNSNDLVFNNIPMTNQNMNHNNRMNYNSDSYNNNNGGQEIPSNNIHRQWQEAKKKKKKKKVIRKNHAPIRIYKNAFNDNNIKLNHNNNYNNNNNNRNYFQLQKRPLYSLDQTFNHLTLDASKLLLPQHISNNVEINNNIHNEGQLPVVASPNVGSSADMLAGSSHYNSLSNHLNAGNGHHTSSTVSDNSAKLVGNELTKEKILETKLKELMSKSNFMKPHSINVTTSRGKMERFHSVSNKKNTKTISRRNEYNIDNKQNSILHSNEIVKATASVFPKIIESKSNKLSIYHSNSNGNKSGIHSNAAGKNAMANASRRVSAEESLGMTLSSFSNNNSNRNDNSNNDDDNNNRNRINKVDKRGNIIWKNRKDTRKAKAATKSWLLFGSSSM